MFSDDKYQMLMWVYELVRKGFSTFYIYGQIALKYDIKTLKKQKEIYNEALEMMSDSYEYKFVKKVNNARLEKLYEMSIDLQEKGGDGISKCLKVIELSDKINKETIENDTPTVFNVNFGEVWERK
jgi:hypothetical protein